MTVHTMPLPQLVRLFGMRRVVPGRVEGEAVAVNRIPKCVEVADEKYW